MKRRKQVPLLNRRSPCPEAEFRQINKDCRPEKKDKNQPEEFLAGCPEITEENIPQDNEHENDVNNYTCKAEWEKYIQLPCFRIEAYHNEKGKYKDYGKDGIKFFFCRHEFFFLLVMRSDRCLGM